MRKNDLVIKSDAHFSLIIFLHLLAHQKFPGNYPFLNHFLDSGERKGNNNQQNIPSYKHVHILDLFLILPGIHILNV